MAKGDFYEENVFWGRAECGSGGDAVFYDRICTSSVGRRY